MPKSIIREIDKSTPGSTLSANFSVLVPGYVKTGFNTAELRKEAKDAGILIELDNVYHLTSQSQFNHYIGQFEGREIEKAPELEVVNENIDETDTARAISAQAVPATAGEPLAENAVPTTGVQYYTRTTSTDGAGHLNDGEYAYAEIDNANIPAEHDGNTYYPLTELGSDAEYTDSFIGITRYAKQLEMSEIYKELPENNIKVYAYEELASSHKDFGKNGYLLKTIVDEANNTHTFKFTEVDINTLDEDVIVVETKAVTNEAYVQIKLGNEGVTKLSKSDHLGNKIAYELLGLGYEVYFKVMDPSQSTVGQLNNSDFWNCFKNKATYQIRYITSGGCYDKDVAAKMAELAKFNNTATLETAETLLSNNGRGDCVALLDIDENFDSTAVLTTRSGVVKAFGKAAKALPHSKYCAIFAPKVVYADDLNTEYPCSFHYLACAALAQERYAEWYAVAGYSRGISSKSIAYTTYNFGDIDINTLAPRVVNIYTDAAINLILNERGNYYLWGNRTSYPLDNEGLIFSHFLNIRQLCCTLKQVLYEATRTFTFDPNSDLLWFNFVNMIRPTLERMKADQGIKGYKITKVATETKALLKAKIRIVPIEAVEDFDISIHLEDSISGIILDVDEEEAE